MSKTENYKMDTNNLATLWSLLERRLRAFIMSKVHDEAETDDIIQELFIKIHDKIDTLRDDNRVEQWVFQITRNLIYDHFRSRKKEGIILDGQDNEHYFDGGDTENFMAETLEDMIKMMDRLPPKYCEALCLTELGNMNQLEYSKHLGLSYSAAKSRIQRARAMLRDMLMNCCHYHFDKYGTVIDVHPIKCCCCHQGQI